MRKAALYLFVTNDQYELPMAVADTVYEMADMLGVTGSAVSKGVRLHERGGHSQYRRIWVQLTNKEAEERGHNSIVRQIARCCKA